MRIANNATKGASKSIPRLEKKKSKHRLAMFLTLMFDLDCIYPNNS